MLSLEVAKLRAGFGCRALRRAHGLVTQPVCIIRPAPGHSSPGDRATLITPPAWLRQEEQEQMLVGIDLDTTNSLIGIWVDDRPQLIRKAFGDVLTPSVVGVDDAGTLLVGATAKERLIS